MKVLFIGAHADDIELMGGGVAQKYLERGHQVRFLVLTDGRGGHHMMGPEEIRQRRKQETQAVAALTGIQYDVWPMADGELVADLDTRKKLTAYVREYAPDIVFCHQPNEYHPDHRAAGTLLQDVSYLLIVPNFCPDAPAMTHTPVMLYYADTLRNLENPPDIAVDIDDVIDKKYQMVICHESQMFEWLPFTRGTLDQVPEGKAERLFWLKGDAIDSHTPDEEIINGTVFGYNRRFALPAAKYRRLLQQRYGPRGDEVVFAEVFSACPFGAPLTEDGKKRLFPF